MPLPADPLTIFDAARAADAREIMATALGTAGLREKGAEILARSVFSARATNALFLSGLKDVISALAAGTLSEGQARTALWETLDALGYDAERGGFQGEELEPALKGTLQDLKSFRRRDLIVRTQLELMRGAGQQTRGHTPDRLALYPAWELVRVAAKMAPRNWGGPETGSKKNASMEARWTIAGGRLASGRMVALKGDPVWGELGSYGNFKDALGTDHPPFAFNSGMGWREVAAEEAAALGVTGPNGETPDQWFETSPLVMAGKLPLPAPKISLQGVDPAIVKNFVSSTKATPDAARPGVFDFSDILARELAASRAAYGKGKR
jgi:hypothetical protein